MSTRRTLAERGVWGRPATDEERERLQRFLADFRRGADQRRANDEKKLGELVRDHARELGISPTRAVRERTLRRGRRFLTPTDVVRAAVAAALGSPADARAQTTTSGQRKKRKPLIAG